MIERKFKGNSIIDFPNNYIVIDIETTGLDPQYDEIIEISAIKIENNKIVDNFSSLVQPSKSNSIDSFISSLTGITNAMLSQSTYINDVLPRFKNFIDDNVLVGHNVNFDINFLYDNFITILNEPLTNNFIDTMRISKKLLPEFKHHRLDDLIEYFHKEERQEHRALNDCILTNEIYIELYNLAMQKYETIDNFKNQFKHIKHIIRAKDIQPQNIEFDEDNPIYNKTCVFTGALEKMTRANAMQIVANLGGICSDNVTKHTNFLILGNNDYHKNIIDGKSSKQKKAEELKLKGQDIEIISENVFYDMIPDIILDK